MNEDILGLLGVDVKGAKEKAFARGLLSTIFNAAALSGPQARPVSNVQALGQLGLGAMEAYDTSFDKTLKEAMTGLQLKDVLAKREREANLQKAIQGAYTPSMTMADYQRAQSNIDPMALESGMSALDVAQQATPTGPLTIDRNRALQALAQYGGTEGMSAYLAATKPEKQVFTDTFANTALSMYGTADVNKLTPPQRLAVQEAVNAGKKPLVVMNQGQQGFSNEMDLKKAFTGEPVYKAGQEVRSAFDQIKTSLAKESPAGDLAAATKFMKLLDPGSVVRESELFMAMNATGLLDRYMNYATMAIEGTKLSPQQRKDFGDLSIQLYNAAANAYNKKYGEYSTLGTGFGLDAKRALGEPMQTFQPGPTKTGSSIDAINAEIKRRGL